MKCMVMVSHGEFAPELYSAVKMMVGERDDVLSTSLKAGMSADEFAASFRTLVEPLNADDSVVLLADILSGSPLANASAVLDEKGPMPNILAFAGINVPPAITAVLMKDNFDDTELLKRALLNEGHAGLAEFKIESDDAEDDIWTSEFNLRGT